MTTTTAKPKRTMDWLAAYSTNESGPHTVRFATDAAAQAWINQAVAAGKAVLTRHKYEPGFLPGGVVFSPAGSAAKPGPVSEHAAVIAALEAAVGSDPMGDSGEVLDASVRVPSMEEAFAAAMPAGSVPESVKLTRSRVAKINGPVGTASQGRKPEAPAAEPVEVEPVKPARKTRKKVAG